jgi:methylated-DNA-[protein]-cysteine S-methyltransferase
MNNLFTGHLKWGDIILQIITDQHAVKVVSFVESLPVNSDFQPHIIEETQQQLTEYFEGTRREFDLALQPEGTDFQKKVWNQLLQIDFGKTLSYAQMAQQLGDTKVIRAAASANGKNPIAVIIPCHRVIGIGGALTGYAGGLSRKKFLLDHENRIANGILEIF